MTDPERDVRLEQIPFGLGDDDLPQLDPDDLGGSDVAGLSPGQQSPSGSSESGYNGNEALPAITY